MDQFNHIIEDLDRSYDLQPRLKSLKQRMTPDLLTLPAYISHQIETIYNCVISMSYSTPSDSLIPILNSAELVLDFLLDELNTGQWCSVSLPARRTYTFISYLKVLLYLYDNSTRLEATHLTKCIQYADSGLLMGAPIDNEQESVLTWIARLLNTWLKSKIIVKPLEGSKSDLKSLEKCDDGSDHFKEVQGHGLREKSCPPISDFYVNHFLPHKPVKLLDCLDSWPAVSKWSDVTYLKEKAGERTIPVELGSRYTDDNWTQKLMTLKQFIDNYFSSGLSNTNVCGYLAQHNLFDQIPELRDDIIIPDYCALSDLSEDTSDPNVNAWFGPKGTISPLHYDPDHNLLAQVFGRKQIYLFDPTDSEFLYPFEGRVLNNTAQVDPSAPDLSKFPNFSQAKAYKCTLGPKEILYIPPKWWHHVTALEASFSVSFWWK